MHVAGSRGRQRRETWSYVGRKQPDAEISGIMASLPPDCSINYAGWIRDIWCGIAPSAHKRKIKPDGVPYGVRKTPRKVETKMG